MFIYNRLLHCNHGNNGSRSDCRALEPSIEPAENDARSTSGLAQLNPSCSIPTFETRLVAPSPTSVHQPMCKLARSKRNLLIVNC